MAIFLVTYNVPGISGPLSEQIGAQTPNDAARAILAKYPGATVASIRKVSGP